MIVGKFPESWTRPGLRKAAGKSVASALAGL